MRIVTKWTNGLIAKDKEAMRKRIESSRDVLERLEEMLQIELDESIKKAAKEENFSLPAWSEFQANMLGEQKCLRKIIEWMPKDK